MRMTFCLLGMLLLACGNTYAQHYKAETTFNFPGNQFYQGGIAKLNDDLFITYMEGQAGKGVYAQNRKTGQSELILTTNVSFQTGVWDGFFRPLENAALIDLFGKLYITDGTQAGTRFIADFGYTSSGGSLGYFFSRVDKVVQAGRFLYISQTAFFAFGESADQDESALWRIDLTDLKRTKIYQDELFGYGGFELVDSTDQSESAIVFANRGDAGVGFWSASPEMNQIEPLALFENKDGRVLDIQWQWRIRTRSGLFFCRSALVQGENSVEESEYSVWRLSNSNTLTRIAESCGGYGDAAVSFDNEQLFFTLNDGLELWQNSGTTTSSRLIWQLPENEGLFQTVCTAGKYLIAQYVDYNDWEVVNGRYNITYRVYIFSSNGFERYLSDVRVSSCIGDKVMLNNPNATVRGNDSVYIPKNNRRIKIFGISASEDLLGYSEFSDDVLFLYRKPVGVTANQIIDYRRRLVHLVLKEGPYVAYLPSVLKLLEE